MRQFNKITIIGVGLIGGSIGLSIKKKGIAKEVVGVFRHRRTLEKALRAGAVDTGFQSIEEGVKDADLIIVATPVFSIPKIVCEAAIHAKSGAIITDVGSTKGWVIEKIKERMKSPGRVFFVGSHPMAGSERAGVEYARKDLLEGSPCIVTVAGNTDKNALKRVADFWKQLGTRVSIMTARAHDRNVALISHLPHVVAFGLAGAVPEKALCYAAEGFKDTTRVASSDPELWAEIFLTNTSELSKACRDFESFFKKMRKAIAAKDVKKTIRLLKAAKAKRDKFMYGAEK